MSSHPKVSIVTISYNQEKFIRDTLEGFVAQKTNFDFEAIIADDASSDQTPQIIREFAKKYPDIIKPILRQKNLGAAPNFIDALRGATGDYIAICEGDDYWTDLHKLQLQSDLLDSNPDFPGCFHRVRVIFEDDSEKGYIFPAVDDKTWYTTEELLRTNYIPTNSVMYRRLSYDNLPINVMPLDWYMHLYHSQRAPLVFIDKVMSVYRKHQGGIWWEYDQDRDKIWLKYGQQFLQLFIEAEKLFGKDKGRKKIIEDTLFTTLGTLIRVDQKYKKDLSKTAFEEHPEIEHAFTVYQYHKIEQQIEMIDTLKAELLKLGDERTELVNRIGKLNQEINTAAKELEKISNSRTWRMKQKADAIKNKITRQ